METDSPGAAQPHRSVLLNESLEHLNLKPGSIAVDCTLGAGGHSAAIIERIKPGGRLIALDVDPQALGIARARLEPLAASGAVQLELVQSNFSQLSEVLDARGGLQPHGILADLGVSSMQFDTPERGFSFRFDEPLDMRMDPTLPETAADILNHRSEEELADIFFFLGEERKARPLARAVVASRKTQPMRTTGQLEEFVRRVLRVRGWRHTHPATKVFQALRLAVNREMDVLASFLEQAPEKLSDGGVLAVITFHSLEDRQVKQRFKALDATGRFHQTVKFVSPGEDEIQQNPRSRSAKLRVIQKVDGAPRRSKKY
jgi:16S rRNA (cytosine1402-N4)-methyltransferase